MDIEGERMKMIDYNEKLCVVSALPMIETTYSFFISINFYRYYV